jgi:phytanoyl-CoA hydroxylase
MSSSSSSSSSVSSVENNGHHHEDGHGGGVGGGVGRAENSCGDHVLDDCSNNADGRWNELRAHAQEVFVQLAQQAADDHVNVAESWVRAGHDHHGSPDNHDTKEDGVDRRPRSSAKGRFFDYSGFLHVTNFVTMEECNNMKQQMADLVEQQWDVTTTTSGAPLLDSFGTDNAQNRLRGDYFLESADKVHFFAEPDALVVQENTTENMDDNNKRVVVLKECYRHNKIAALNRAGHALHIQDGAFRDYCLSKKICNLVTNDLGWQDPVVPQSMYIFKQARHGGVVTSHQDSTFLYTEPRQTCLGLWLALDDAHVDNGCLWIRPRSHLEPVRRQFKRNPLHFGDNVIQARGNQPAGGDGDMTQPKFVMENLVDQDDMIAWEGSLPGNTSQQDDDKQNDHTDISDTSNSSSCNSVSRTMIRSLVDAGFVPVECQAGDLLAFCGQLDHLSLKNTSRRPRHTFQLHLVEGPGAGVTWSESNWLQYPNGKPFLRLLRGGQDEEEEGDQR